MRRWIYSTFALFLFILTTGSAFADNVPQPQVGTQAKGNYFKTVIIDSISNQPLEFATLSAIYEGETKPSKYALSDVKGVVILQGLKPGRYTIRFEYMGYKTKTIKYEMKRGGNEMEKFYVREDVNMLNAVVVSDVGNQMQVKKDTIEYNAASFKINDSDMLEELLKKLPGVEIASDGTITANGKTINKIMIDGKTFFLDDPQLATKNLPAKIVNKVRVVERKSDQAQFTGIDDGEEETVLDLNIKKGMMDGWFGNFSGGYGTKDRYEAAGMFGKFTQKTQISFIGNGNNTNNRGFNDLAASMMGNMRGGGRGGFNFSGNGITTSWMGGVNANTEVLGGDMKLSGNYLYSGSDKNIKERSSKETFLYSGKSMFNNAEGFDKTRTDGHRFAAEMDYKISENTSILFRPRFNFGSGDFNSENRFSTLTGADSTNRGYSRSYGDNNSKDMSGNLLLRQRLGKPGRTMSVNFTYSFSDNDITGYNLSNTHYFVNDSNSIIDQKYKADNNSYGLGARLSYTEPLGKNFFVEGEYGYNYKQSKSDKDTYNKDANGYYTLLDDDYTSHYKNTFVTQRAELSFMKQEEKYNITIGGSLQPSSTTSTGRGRDTTYTVLNFAPSARFDYKFSDSKFLRIRYRGRTSQPSLNQLLPIPDNSNPLNITIGNPDLNPEFSHNLQLEYRTNNPQKMSWFGTNINASYTTDKIISRIWYDDNGVRYIQPYNDNTGIYSTNAMVMFNTRLGKSDFSIFTFSRVGFNNSISYVSSAGKYIKNITRNLSMTENFRLTYRNNTVEITAGGRTTYNNAWYSVKGQSKAATWSNAINGSFNINIPGGLNITSDISHNFYFGYGEGYGESKTIWNAEISKTLFKSAATLKVKIYDILKDSKNIYRTTTDNYIQDVENNTLGQYVMVSLVYRFGKFNAGSMRRGAPGGPGGGRGGYRR